MIIVLFHVLYLLGKIVYRSYKYSYQHRTAMEIEGNTSENEGTNHRKTNRIRRHSQCDSDGENNSPVIRFSPPAFIQRYQTVQNVLTDASYRVTIRKVVDFGCSELGFCTYLKHIHGIEEVICVDIDRQVLEQHKERASPLYSDYLHRRTTPLKFCIYEGSVTDHDKVLENCDAVVCIELIEHLWPETLTDLPFNIFGYIKPQVAIITTPNADFNVLFKNFSGFRHPDHKFEWTRQQFEDWSNNVISRYPEYEVTFHGICNGPPGTENLGACSQMGVFYRTRVIDEERPVAVQGLFKEIVVHEYPYRTDNRSDEEKILDDAVFYIRSFSGNDESMQEEVPLQLIVESLKKFHIDIDDLKEILRNAGWAIENRQGEPFILIPPPSGWSTISSKESDFLDENPPRYPEWDEPEPGPGPDYLQRLAQREDSSITEEVLSPEYWDESSSECPVVYSHLNYQSLADHGPSNSECLNPEIYSSSSSFNPEDIRPEDLEMSSFSDQANRSTARSVTISSFPEMSGSESTNDMDLPNAETLRDDDTSVDVITLSPFKSLRYSSLPKKSRIENSGGGVQFFPGNDLSNEYDSMCSICLEPSSISQGSFDLSTHRTLTEKSSDERTVDTMMAEKNDSENDSTASFSSISTFTPSARPMCTSSPQLPTSKKRKSNESTRVCTNSDVSECDVNRKLLENSSVTFMSSDTSASSESILLQNWFPVEASSMYKTEEAMVLKGGSEDPDKPAMKVASGSYVGTEAGSPSNDSLISESAESIQSYVKVANLRVNTEAKPTSPEALESPLNSWSPEILDSGYPNSASAPDMTPEYDLSSIAHDQISEPESPSIEDAPRPGFLDRGGVENGDLANNNRDGEGNNMEAAEDRVLNELQPLIDRLENDLENENDIYGEQNGFPMWLLRILQRLDLPQIHQPGLRLHNLAAGDGPNEDREQDEGFDSTSNDNDDDYSDVEDERSVTEDPSITEECSENANRAIFREPSEMECDRSLQNDSVIAQCNSSNLEINFSTSSNNSAENENESLRDASEAYSVDAIRERLPEMPGEDDDTNTDFAVASSSMELGRGDN